MPTFPYTLPVELIERIIKLSFLPAGRRDPPPSPPSTSLLSVSKAVRLLALPYFFEVVSIRRKEDWQTFFDPSSGIFVEGEEGERRWSWVKELVVPLEFPPPLNTHYTFGQPSYFIPLTIPNSKKIDCLRYLPFPTESSDSRHGSDRTALLELLANGEDPAMVFEAEGETENVYVHDESEDDDEEEEPPKRKQGTRKKQTKRISRRHREFPTLEDFLQSEEGLDRTKFSLFEALSEVLEVLDSDFYHCILPTQLSPRLLFLPEALPFASLSVVEPNPHLVFFPDGHQSNGSINLNVVRYPQTRPSFKGDLREDGNGDVPLVASRKSWQSNGPVVLDGFKEGWLREFKELLLEGGKEEELGRWSWRSKRGVVRPLRELRDEQ
ncbi:hypothetical protein BDY24DRAFT_388490 [Mrakia frigida]|uniref:uncharacterized protein n=1 Tax=Mrakia frigida TaxID=29902 RepID=UPI003FCBFCDB